LIRNKLEINILSKEEVIDHLFPVEEDQEMVVMLHEKNDEALVVVE
jgi:hypothetical protein